MTARRSYRLIVTRGGRLPSFLADASRVDHIEVVEIDSGEVVLYWDCEPPEILPDPVRKFSNHDVVFRPIVPALKMEAGVAWKRDNSSSGLRGYVEIVKSLSTSMR